MRLLIITQVVDIEDLYLGFFVRWIEELARGVENIEVICLKEGEYQLPANVRVHSLGKERGAENRVIYVWRFLKFAWVLRRNYNKVFVHMNQEYVLIAGWLWKLLGKPIYMWRNHYAGSWLTDVAAAFCTKVFCTSKYSYTAKYKKTVLMPVGVDTERFAPDARITRKSRSILFFARMSPSKRPELLLEALAELVHGSVDFTTDFVGSPLAKDEAYYEKLQVRARELGLSNNVSFLPGVPNTEASDLYRAYEIFVNCAPPGMFDKTLFEAAASGCHVLSSSKDFAELAGPDSHFSTAADLADRLRASLSLPPHTFTGTQSFVADNDLKALSRSLVCAIVIPT